MRFIQLFISTVLLITCAGSINAMDNNLSKTDSMKIRFYTGNLSVGHFMEYWGTGKQLPGDVPTDDFCNQMKSVSVSAVTDYIGWCCVEPEQGKFDWSFYDNNQQILEKNGLDYNIFAWLHFVPKWFTETADYVPYRCAEHDEPIQMTSLWAPGTLKLYDRFYKSIAEHFGDRIDFIRLATPSEYGEIGYPNGMTNWLVKQDHAHAGYWCNDKYARADFNSEMEKKYKDIPRLNSAWRTSFKSFDAVEYPDIAKDRSKFIDPLKMSPQERMRILDFIGWYYGSQSRFIRNSVSIVRKYFPGKEIIVSMGYGSQLTAYGNDDVGIAKLCKELKVSCQTPGNVDYICLKSLSTPCHYYGVPYFTEPPGDVDKNAQINRIWADSSNGVQTFFDYPQNLLRAKDEFAKYRDILSGKKSVVETAVLFPTTDHRLRFEDWPVRTITGVNVLREVIDYDLVDERLIREGILKNYKVLIAYDGNIMEESTLNAIRKWVSSGGVLIFRNPGIIETIDGKRDFYENVVPKPIAKGTVADTVKNGSKQIGKGFVINIEAQDNDYFEFALLTSDIAYNLSKYYPGRKDVIHIDDTIDGVLTTLFKDRITCLNHGDKLIEKTIKLRKADFNNRKTGKPAKYEYNLKIEPHSIAEIELD